jgi:hypothetical protein
MRGDLETWLGLLSESVGETDWGARGVAQQCSKQAAGYWRSRDFYLRNLCRDLRISAAGRHSVRVKVSVVCLLDGQMGTLWCESG